MHEIISCVIQNKLTTVQGMPGMGKTTIAKTDGHHLQERRTFHDGVVFFSMRGTDQTNGLIQMMYLFFQRIAGLKSDEKSVNQSMARKNKILKSQSVMPGSNEALGIDQIQKQDDQKQVDYTTMEMRILQHLF